MRKEAGWQWYNSIGLALNCSRGNFQTIGSLPTLQISLGIVALFEKIYYEVLTIFSNIEEEVQYCCFN
jgi:hypothetical protein